MVPLRESYDGPEQQLLQLLPLFLSLKQFCRAWGQKTPTDAASYPQLVLILALLVSSDLLLSSDHGTDR